MNIIDTSRKNFKLLTMLTSIVLVFLIFVEPVNAWRSVRTVNVRGQTLAAKADLPYFSSWDGGGNWKAQAVYSGAKTDNKLSLSWSFYTVGGSVSFNGAGVSGSGSNPGGSFTVRGSTANASGRVYGHGLCLYLEMYSTASFTYGNSYYSTTTKI